MISKLNSYPEFKYKFFKVRVFFPKITKQKNSLIPTKISRGWLNQNHKATLLCKTKFIFLIQPLLNVRAETRDFFFLCFLAELKTPQFPSEIS